MTYIIVFMVIDVTFISFCSWYYTVKWFEMCKCCKCLECVSCHLLKAAVTCGHGEGGGGGSRLCWVEHSMWKMRLELKDTSECSCSTSELHRRILDYSLCQLLH